ncbi:MAG: T9SS type A sorting domain-containing protein [Fibromonadales bacterium]|nr:T9SS type A sorting domain-containing protein [Fibromonadales bacterium]
MKKILALSLFAMAAFVSQAWGETCVGPNGSNACEIGGGCYKFSTEYSGVTGVCEVPNCTCVQLVKNCTDNGSWYSGVTGLDQEPYGKGWKCSEHEGTWQAGKDPNRVSTGCCKFAADVTGKCWDTWSATEASDCQTGSNTFWSSKCPDTQGTCPTGSPTYDGGSKTSLGCCKFAADPTGKCWDVFEAEAAADCQTGDNQFWSGKCPDGAGTCPGGTPILKFPTSQALLVAPYGRSLHISSARDAMVSLYDMSGAKVYSGKVRAGNSVFSLEKVPSGSYYAVVQSGSDSKKLSVILK